LSSPRDPILVATPHATAQPVEKGTAMATRRFPLVGKAISIVFVLIALTLALQSVSGIVAEREGRLREAERSVAASLASAQTIVGPIVARDCSETWETTEGEGKDKKTVVERRDFKLTATPATLEMKGDAAIEPRYRGIFKVNGYVLKARLRAGWDDGTALVPQAQHAGSRVRCDAPVLLVALGDSRGVHSAAVQIDGAVVPVLPGTLHRAHPRGFHADVAESFAGARRPLAAEVGIELVGTGELAFAPVGGSTQVVLASDWPHPSFGGRFLPLERQVGETGFSARWQLNALATTAPQATAHGAPACRLYDAGDEQLPSGELRRHPCVETFGVAFIDPVSPYVLSDRATKYGLLFIALTFVGVAAIEVLRRLRGPSDPVPARRLGAGSLFPAPRQPLRARSVRGRVPRRRRRVHRAADVLRPFVLRGSRAGAAFGVAIAALYGALYALLQLEQTALLLGSVPAVRGPRALMVATRRIDWYGLFARMRARERRCRRGGAAGADAGGVTGAPPGGLLRRERSASARTARRPRAGRSGTPRRLVGSPADERRRVAEAVALEMVVLDLADALGTQRLPRQVLAGAPAARRSWHPLRVRCRLAVLLGPVPPRMVAERVSCAAERARRRGDGARPS
jgi:inner membrane protein